MYIARFANYLQAASSKMATDVERERLELLTLAVLSLVLLSHGGGVEGRTLSAVWRGPWRHEIVEGLHPQAAVTANFTNHINQTG